MSFFSGGSSGLASGVASAGAAGAVGGVSMTGELAAAGASGELPPSPLASAPSSAASPVAPSPSFVDITLSISDAQKMAQQKQLRKQPATRRKGKRIQNVLKDAVLFSPSGSSSCSAYTWFSFPTKRPAISAWPRILQNEPIALAWASVALLSASTSACW